MVWGGGKRYVTNVCMYAALFRLYSGIMTQTARRRRRRESVPFGLNSCLRWATLSLSNCLQARFLSKRFPH